MDWRFAALLRCSYGTEALLVIQHIAVRPLGTRQADETAQLLGSESDGLGGDHLYTRHLGHGLSRLSARTTLMAFGSAFLALASSHAPVRKEKPCPEDSTPYDRRLAAAGGFAPSGFGEEGYDDQCPIKFNGVRCARKVGKGYVPHTDNGHLRRAEQPDIDEQTGEDLNQPAEDLDQAGIYSGTNPGDEIAQAPIPKRLARSRSAPRLPKTPRRPSTRGLTPPAQ